MHNRPPVTPGFMTQPLDSDPSYNLSAYGSAYLVHRMSSGLSQRCRASQSRGMRLCAAKVFNQTNGLLFPGGGTSVSRNTTYRRAGMLLLKMAIDANQANDVYPIWGTCLGFEELMVLSANSSSVLNHTSGTDPLIVPLRINLGAAFSRLLGGEDGTPGARARDALATAPITVHLHHFGVLLLIVTTRLCRASGVCWGPT